MRGMLTGMQESVPSLGFGGGKGGADRSGLVLFLLVRASNVFAREKEGFDTVTFVVYGKKT